MILETDVSHGRAAVVRRQLTYKRAVQPDADVPPVGLDLEGVPLSDRPRRTLIRGRERVDRARQMEWISRLTRLGIDTALVDLDLVALIDRDPPVMVRLSALPFRSTSSWLPPAARRAVARRATEGVH